MNTREKKADLVLYAIAGAIPVIWIGLMIAPYSDDGIVYIVSHIDDIFKDPWDLKLNGGSIKTVLLLLLAYAMGIGVYLSSRKNYRRGEEHGSARWGVPFTLNRKYSDHEYANNKLLTQNVRIGLDGKKHRRNLNVLVIGGSGAGKTRFYCKPNLMQANTSFVVLDPNDETNYSHFFITFFQRREMQ